MSNFQFLIYGANGYTGKLILQEALKQNLRPTIAGRNKEQIEQLASEYAVDYRIFSLNSHSEIVEGLKGMALILNCAGPFINTVEPVIKACLEQKVHYFDITGEIDVFAIAHSFHQQAKENNIVLCPGTGFDVVPTDCLALRLKEEFKTTASSLELAFHSQGGPSKGTALTSFNGTGKGVKVRREGKIITVPYGTFQKDVTFPHKTLRVASIPWGDVFTAFISTNIPDITVYMVMHPKTISKLSKGQKLLFLTKVQPIKWYLKRKIIKSIKGGGPSAETLTKTQSYIWGKIADENNNSIELFLKTPNGYVLTALASIQAIIKLQSLNIQGGYYTPSLLFGSSFVLDIPGVELIQKAL